MKNGTLKLLILLGTLLLFKPVFSQEIIHEPLPIKIENYINQLEKSGLYGSVLVSLENRLFISKEFGYQDKKEQLLNTSKTVFDIGSITKQFTAAAILKLEMEGKLSVKDKLSKFFPSVPDDKKDITIHDLLTHTSGLPRHTGPDYGVINKKDFLKETFDFELKFWNEYKHTYSNRGYSLLGIIIEQVSGLSYEEYLYRNLWKPAGMKNTGYSKPNFKEKNLATGYKGLKSFGKPAQNKWDINAPFWHLKANGGILSTARDLYKWHLALQSDKILDQNAKQKYYNPDFTTKIDLDSYYAYGWLVSNTERNTKVIEHNGSNSIFYADFVRYVDEGITIIVLTNKYNPHVSRISGQISKILFNPSFQPKLPIPDTEENWVFTEKVVSEIIEKGYKQGLKLLKNKPHNIHLLEFHLNSMGYKFLSEKKYEKAIEIFKINTIAYPDSYNTFDSLGEAYMEAGDKNLAIENYKKSISLNPDNRHGIRMLERLEK